VITIPRIGEGENGDRTLESSNAGRLREGGLPDTPDVAPVPQDVDLFFRMFQHLLPRAAAWRITIDKALRQFFRALAQPFAALHVDAARPWRTLEPYTTDAVEAFEEQFALPTTGITLAERRERIAAAWAGVGSLAPHYVQTLLQRQGFDVYLHEWWVPGSEPVVNSTAAATARNPNTYLAASTVPEAQDAQDGEAWMQDGEADAMDGSTTAPVGYVLASAQTTATIPAGSEFWPFFVYVGGAVFPNPATVDPKRRDEFEALVLKHTPAHLWVGIIVSYT
jgi:uncharacterized protein YmfQ (DUF2313 family)